MLESHWRGDADSLAQRLFPGKKNCPCPRIVSAWTSDGKGYHIIPPAVISSANTVPNTAPSTPKPTPGTMNSHPHQSTCRSRKIRKKLNTTSQKHISTLSILGHAYSHYTATCRPQGNSTVRRVRKVKISGNRRMNRSVSFHHHPASREATPLIEMPTTANKELKTNVAVTDWQSIFRSCKISVPQSGVPLVRKSRCSGGTIPRTAMSWLKPINGSRCIRAGYQPSKHRYTAWRWRPPVP